jgi:hypothetical protein
MTVTLARRFGQVRAQAPLIQAALLSAHVASARGDGFVPSDVRFFFLLFTNWIEHDVLRPEQDLELTQVRRVLERLLAERWLEPARPPSTKRASRSKRYALTQAGLVGLVEALVDSRTHRPFEEVLFVLCFASSYRDAIVARVRGEPRVLAPAARRRVAELLNPRRVVEGARRTLGQVLADLERRSSEGRKLQEEADRGRRAGLREAQIIERLEAMSPYQLQRVRPLRDLMNSLPEDLVRIELGSAMGLRTSLLFDPLAEQIRAEMAILDRIDERLKGRGAKGER